MCRLSLQAHWAAAVVLGLLIMVAPARAAGWGDVKGQVVWAGDSSPQQKKLVVNKDQDVCLKNGPLYSQDYVVNPKNKGVRWVVLWLVDATNPRKNLPIHPSLQAVSPKTVELDQPCCQFEPHVLALRQGQTLVVKNSAPVSHNVNMIGGALGPNMKPIMGPGTSLKVPGILARPSVIPVSCGIHPWMHGFIRVFKNPYFAVTDEDGKFEIKKAPAGEFRLVVWQESVGWVTGDRNGTPITIKEDGVTDLGKIDLKPSKEE